MKKWCGVFLSLLLCLTLVTPASAANTHGNPAIPELGFWAGDLIRPYIHSGCLPTVPSSSLTFGAFACTGYVRGAGNDLVYVSQAASTLTLANTTGTHWVALHRDTSSGVSGWTRRSGSHYLVQQASSQPADPSGGVVVVKATVSGGVITAVVDLRTPASYARFGVYDITDPLYGAVGDGSTDDTAALQAAFNSQGGSQDKHRGGFIVCPVGRYKVTSTLTVTRAFHFVGLGAGPGGATTSDGRWNGCAIDHFFNGTLFDIPGISGDVVSPIGPIFENLLLRQTYGNGAAAAGIAFRAVATGDSFKASWIKILNVNLELSVGANDDWTWGFYCDADATTSTAVGGCRDHTIVGGRWYLGAQSTGAVYLHAAANVHITDLLPQGTNPHFSITGSDAAHASYNTSLVGVATGNGNLSLGHSIGTVCSGCQFNQLITTANSSGTHYTGIVNSVSGVSMPAYNTGTVVVANNNFYHWSSGALTAQFSVPTGSVNTLCLAADGTCRWQMIQAASDGSYAFTGPGGTNFLSVNNNGGHTWKKAIAHSIITLTDGANVAVDASLGRRFYLNAGGSRTIDNLGSSISGQEVEVTIRNGTAGAITTSWGGNYKLAGGTWTDPAPGYTRSIRFYVHDSSTFRELSRTSGDAL